MHRFTLPQPGLARTKPSRKQERKQFCSGQTLHHGHAHKALSWDSRQAHGQTQSMRLAPYMDWPHNPAHQ